MGGVSIGQCVTTPKEVWEVGTNISLDTDVCIVTEHTQNIFLMV